MIAWKKNKMKPSRFIVSAWNRIAPARPDKLSRTRPKGLDGAGESKVRWKSTTGKDFPQLTAGYASKDNCKRGFLFYLNNPDGFVKPKLSDCRGCCPGKIGSAFHKAGIFTAKRLRPCHLAQEEAGILHRTILVNVTFGRTFILNWNSWEAGYFLRFQGEMRCLLVSNASPYGY